jgi:hypothetical protein
MAQGWSQSSGWRSYQDWKRWYREHWGGLQATGQPPPGGWRGVYRTFSEADGIQAEVEIVAGRQATTIGDEAEVRRRARASLVRFRDLIAKDPRRLSAPVVVVQVVVDPDSSGLRVGCGEWAAPPTAPRRPVDEQVALALEELDG